MCPLQHNDPPRNTLYACTEFSDGRPEYVGEGRFHSLLTGKTFAVGNKTCLVDATFMKVEVPATRPPAYKLTNDVKLVPPNDLPTLHRPYNNYTVVGAGRTGIDACLWLLSKGIDPAKITWIIPRDSFFLVREGIQPGPLSAESRSVTAQNVNNYIIEASSAEDLLDRLVACGQLLRLDDNIRPTMFHCATVSSLEFEQLKRIGSIVRQGRVVSNTPNEVFLENGKCNSNVDTVYIDCTANGLAKLAPVSVFKGNTIALQPVRYCQQVFQRCFHCSHRSFL